MFSRVSESEGKKAPTLSSSKVKLFTAQFRYVSRGFYDETDKRNANQSQYKKKKIYKQIQCLFFLTSIPPHKREKTHHKGKHRRERRKEWELLPREIYSYKHGCISLTYGLQE